MKRTLSLIVCSIVFLLGCNSGCEATTVHVGGGPGRGIVLVSSTDGSDGEVVVTDSNGDVRVPCGRQVGNGQTR